MPRDTSTDTHAANTTVELKRLRTYQSDVEEALKKGGVSLSGIALAEQNKRAVKVAPPKVLRLSGVPKGERTAYMPRRPFVFPTKALLVIGALFALAFVSIAGYSRLERFLNSSAPTVPLEPTRAETPGGLSFFGNETKNSFVKAVRARLETLPTAEGELRMLPVTAAGHPMRSGDFFTLLHSGAPAELIRVLSGDITLGMYGLRGNQLFLVFPVGSFDHAFGGMLSWEKLMPDELSGLFNIPRASAAASTTSAASSPPVFKDAVIRNKDVRALFDEQGAIRLLYSFLNKETLVIAEREETLRALIGRLSGGRLHNTK